MSGIFLSYKREDSDYATLLYAWLTERFGPEQVFWDREDIDPGKDFRKVLTTRVRSADALVALIGPNWSPSKWIQREIHLALKRPRNTTVLPVIVGNAPPLGTQPLPSSIQKIRFLQSLETRDLRFRQRFLDALDKIIVASPSAPPTDEDRLGRLRKVVEAQVDKNQQNALRLLIQGKDGEALGVLNDTFDLLMALLDMWAGDTSLELRLGFLYKDLAQAFVSSDHARFERYVQSGLQLFEGLVERKLAKDEAAGAWNGLGNMHLLRGNFDQAVESSERAVKVSPEYSYAWSDLFMGYEGQAEHGRPNLAGMKRAFARLKATAGDDPLLSGVIPQYEKTLRRWEHGARRKRNARSLPVAKRRT